MNHALVFDSGVGGLSVVKELRALMPDLHLTYVADDEFRPYGDKTEQDLKARLPGLLWTLTETVKPDVIVLACNTASTTALSEIRAWVNIPVIGVVPAVKPAAQSSATRTIAVLGTPGTVRRQYVDNLIKAHAPTSTVILHGSTGLVQLAEDKLAGRPVSLDRIRAEIMPLFEKDTKQALDVIVLACTHFPLLAEELEPAAPRAVTWIDSGAAIARRTKTVLGECHASPQCRGPQKCFLVGGQEDQERTKMFARFGFTQTVTLPVYKEPPH